jgi:uncharacterized membrane protein
VRVKLILLLLLGLILRLIVVNQSLWLDEAISAETVKNFSYTGIVTEFAKFDFHPPLYYLILKFWTSLFGFSELALRFPSILFGLGTIIVIHKIVAKMIPKDPSVALLSTLLLTTSQLHIYYSQEARMYSLTTLLASLAIYFFLTTLKDGKNKLSWLLYSFSITALIASDYVPLFLLPIFFIYALFEKKGANWWKKYALTYLPIVFLGLVWLPMLFTQLRAITQLKSTLPGWNSIIGGSSVKDAVLVWTKFVFGRISLSNKILYYGLLVIATSIVIIPVFSFVTRLVRSMKLIFLWLIIPLLLGLLVSFVTPVLIYFRFLFVLPAFYILIAVGISRLKPNFAKVLIVLLLIVNLTSWLIYIKDPRQQRETWREATSFVEQRVSSDEIVLFDYPEPITPFRWYSKGLVEAHGATASVSPNPDKTHDKTLNLLKNKNGVYYFEYLRDLSDGQRVVENTLTSQGFFVKEVYNFIGVGQVFHYQK